MDGTVWILGLAALIPMAQAAEPGAGPAAVLDLATGPRIRLAEVIHDFGRIEFGAMARNDFVFTNTGNAALEILDVKPGCGCTTAGQWDRRVEPGKTGRIPLQFNSTGFSGTISKSATVTCNDPSQSNVVLQLRGTIWRPIEVTPPSAYFNVSSEAPTNETKVIRIVNNLETPLVLSDPVCTNKSFQVELAKVKEGKEFELRVTAVPPFASTYVQGSVSVKTSSTNMPAISVPVYANVQPVVQVVPSQLYLPAGPLTSGMQPSITVRNTGTNVLALSEPSINLEGATVAVREIQPGKVFSLAVSFPMGVELQSTQQVALTFKSNHPKYPTVRVPVYQQQQRRVQQQPTIQPQAVPTAVARPVVQEGIPPLLRRPASTPAVPPPVPVQ
jgi:hypothetical protein